MTEVQTPAYGLDKEVAAKIASKYDPAKEKEVQDWIEQVTGTRFQGGFQESLKSGMLLCKLLNCIKKDAVPKINTQSMPFMQRENISYFLNGCRELGMRNTDLFDTQDLYDNKNIVHVIESIHALAVYSRNVPTFRGPYIGHLKIAQKNERNFTEEQLAQAHAAPTLLAMGGLEAKKRASKDGGPDIILDRQIIQNVEIIKAEQKKSQDKGQYGETCLQYTSLRYELTANACKACGGAMPSGNFCGNCGAKRS